MITNPIEIEGTWEQIAEQGSRYAGHKMRLTVLPEYIADTPVAEDTRSLEEKMAEVLTRVPEEEWAKLPADMGDNLDHYIYGTPKRG
jgi:hypothetical protein